MKKLISIFLMITFLLLPILISGCYHHRQVPPGQIKPEKKGKKLVPGYYGPNGKWIPEYREKY